MTINELTEEGLPTDAYHDVESGVARDDLEIIARQFRVAAYNAYSNTLIGNPPPVVIQAFDRMKDPKVGDLVIETSTIFRAAKHEGYSHLDGIGYLEEVAYEDVVFSDPDWVWDPNVEGQPCPQERVTYIRTFDGRRFRWTNAGFVAVLTDLLSMGGGGQPLAAQKKSLAESGHTSTQSE